MDGDNYSDAQHPEKEVVMRSVHFFPAILLFASSTLADDIYFRNGYVWQNVFVKDTIDNRITVIATTGERHFPLTTIDKIVRTPYEPEKGSIISNWNAESSAEHELLKSIEPQKEWPNVKLLPVGLLTLALSWHFLSEASDQGDEIDDLKKAFPSADVGRAESRKDRFVIMGVVAAAAGVLTTYISLKPVEINASPIGLKILYNFD